MTAAAAAAASLRRGYVLSVDQLKCYDETGFLRITDALPAGLVDSLPILAGDLADLGSDLKAREDEGVLEASGLMVHFEEVEGGSGIRLCRVENFCSSPLAPAWGEVCFQHISSLVGQLFREEAVLFKDKLNFKGPGGGGFLCHQDATAYATGDLAATHISVLVAVDAATVANGAIQVHPAATSITISNLTGRDGGGVTYVSTRKKKEQHFCLHRVRGHAAPLAPPPPPPPACGHRVHV